MADFQELVTTYKKRSKDRLVDTVALCLSCAESVTEDAGLLADTGVLKDVLSTAGGVLPFAVIAVTEEMKVILGRKDQKTMFKDTAYRMAMPELPEDILVSAVEALLREDKDWMPQEEYYSRLTSVFGKASECIACGQCEEVCPQHLPIIENLKTVAEHFEG